MPAKVRARTLGSFIRRLRTSRRVTQKNMAAAAGVCQSFYSYIESGDRLPKESHLVGIAGLLGVETGYLMRLMPSEGRDGFAKTMRPANLRSTDENADHACARELAKIHTCTSCGARPTTAVARALVDALAEMRGLSATAQGTSPTEGAALAELWEVAQSRLDLISALIDAE